jgi:predicted O-methyltransferase YrrM
MSTLEQQSGFSPEALCNAFYLQQPKWVQGSLSYSDSRFLFTRVLDSAASSIIEIGTASGFSTALLCYALSVSKQRGIIGANFQVVSYDMTQMWHRDRSKKVGDAARAQLSQDLLAHVAFRNPTMAADAAKDFANDEVEFYFIDANHRHPWPTLDLLAMLHCLKPGGLVVLHDINLPVIHPEFPDWGAKYLFDELISEKNVPSDLAMPNIGSIRVPADKESFKAQLLRILFAHTWHAEIKQDYLDRLGIQKQ